MALLAGLWGIFGGGNIQISGIVIPHHDMVAGQRREFLKTVSSRIQPKTIILVSPNHYDLGKRNVQTADQGWSLADGAISSRSGVVQALMKAGVGDEPSSFSDEHGIRLVLADLHRAFPQANMVPLILKSTTTKEDLVSVEEVLSRSCKECVMVDSVDFSHYQPALLADLHDTHTLRALENRDADVLRNNTEVDSSAALTLLAMWAKERGAEHFSLWKHTNSGELLQNADIESTTHMFGWYESGKKAVPKKSVTFTFGGDVMFGRMIAHTFSGKNLSHVFSPLGDRTFWGVDASVVNLEGPISPIPVEDDFNSKKLIFHFPPQAISALQFLRVTGASLANNHSANAGRAGVEKTQELLQGANIQAIGGPGDQDIPHVGVFQGEKIRLVVIGVHTLYGAPDLRDLISSYAKEKDTRVILFPHWGVEYASKHIDYQEGLAHAWIDAGADLVIGSHPHVIQDAEVYKGKPIIYSLGNFVFDQNFSKETQEGLFVAGEFTEKGLTLFGLPVHSIRYQPSLMRGADKKKILDTFYQSLSKYIEHTSLGDRLFFPIE